MLTTETNTASYVGNGVAVNFILPVRVNEASHLDVRLYDSVTGIWTPLSTSEYTASGFDTDTGVTVTYPLIGSPISSSVTIVLDRVLPLTQNLAFGAHSQWSAESIEDQFDLVTMMLQQLHTNIDRSIYGPEANDIASAAIAAAGLFVAKAGSMMTGELILKAGTSGSPSLRLQTGIAPAAPVTGQIWSVGTSIKAYLGATYTVVMLEQANVWGAGLKQSFTHSGVTAGARLVPAANDPSALVDGDLWYTSVTSRYRVRVAGVSADMGIPGVTAETLGQIASFNDQAGAYQFSLLDAGMVVKSTGAGAQTFTIPANATIAFPVKTYITIMQYGTGQITITPAGGVTLRSAGSKTKTVAQYSCATLLKIATNEWVLFGDLTT
jgi:hypothetical protein